MKWFPWFDTSRLERFGEELAAIFADRYPPALEGDDKSASQKKLAGAMNEMFRRVDQFKTEKRLGIYKKAKLGNTFQWKLRELGYSPPFCEKLARNLIIRLTSRD
jgi:hypothetical protein